MSTRSLRKDEVLDMKPANRSTLPLSHESPIDQDLWMGNSRATDGGDTASTEGGGVPRGDGVLHLLSSEPGLVVEVWEPGLVVEVDLFHLPSPSATLPPLLLLFPPRKPTF